VRDFGDWADQLEQNVILFFGAGAASPGRMVGFKNKGNKMKESGVYQIITIIGDMFLDGQDKAMEGGR
jgi:hypothetical protein